MELIEKILIVVDIGSSGTRSHAVDVNRALQVVGTGSSLHRIHKDRKAGDLARRFDSAELRKSIWASIHRAIIDGNLSGSDIGGIAVTAQRGGCAFLDSLGQTLYIGPNTDTRAAFEGGSIESLLGAELYRITGHLPSLFFTPAKIKWFEGHRPSVAPYISSVVSLSAWVVHELTGRLTETAETLVESGIADHRTGQLSIGLLDRIGIPVKWIPDVLPAGVPAGHISKDVADRHGLRKGIPVTIAGPDAHMATLGSGLTEHGSISIIAGWSTPVQRITSKPMLDPLCRAWASPHPAANRWICEANAGDTGRTYDAIRKMVAPRTDPDRFAALARFDLSGERLYTALWGPQGLNLSNLGMSLGGLITASPITFGGIRRSDIAQATLENIAFAIRECISITEDICGEPSDDVHVSGGMSNSTIFCSMLANSLGKPVKRHGSLATARGASMMATINRSQWDHYANQTRQSAEVVLPDDNLVQAYADRYERWVRIREKLDEIAQSI